MALILGEGKQTTSKRLMGQRYTEYKTYLLQECLLYIESRDRYEILFLRGKLFSDEPLSR